MLSSSSDEPSRCLSPVRSMSAAPRNNSFFNSLCNSGDSGPAVFASCFSCSMIISRVRYSSRCMRSDSFRGTSGMAQATTICTKPTTFCLELEIGAVRIDQFRTIECFHVYFKQNQKRQTSGQNMPIGNASLVRMRIIVWIPILRVSTRCDITELCVDRCCSVLGLSN